MAHKIVFTEDALVDLEIILEFIRADNPDAAARFGAALLDHIEILAKSSQIFGFLSGGMPQMKNLDQSRVFINLIVNSNRRVEDFPDAGASIKGSSSITAIWATGNEQVEA